MSRSRRKSPIGGITTAKSDHLWKKALARKLRHRVKQHLTATLDGDHFAGKRWDLVKLDAQLGPFAGRPARDGWVEQAKYLAAGDVAGFEARFGKV